MEPLVALSLAASVAQLIDFASKLVGKTREIALAGSSVSVNHLSTLTFNLLDINNSLKAQTNLARAENAPLTKEEQALHDLIDQCNDVAQELTKSLNSLTVDKRLKTSKWKSVPAALRTIMGKERIDTLAKRLSDFREQLTLRILLLINAQNPSQNGKLDAMRNEIVEVVALNHDSLKAVLEGRYQREKIRDRDERVRAEERHIETMAAILTTREGNSRTIIGIRGGPPPSSTLDPNMSQTTTTYKQAEDKSSSRSEKVRQPATFKTSGFEGITKRILDALHFRSIVERRTTISKAHQRTFEWIYDDKLSQTSPWNNLPEWLRTGRGCYWINGKAGSGKSTLMKYVLENQRTTEALQQWSCSSELVVASFFFWYAGTPIQRSHFGLLRTLLLDVLNPRPDLVPVLFPDLYRSIISKQSLDTIELTDNELRSAFLNLCSSIPKALKIFLIIDGIDEYDGDHYELYELFSRIADFESIKILLSSRPIPACVQAFSRFPKLRLQDLTHDDIIHYVEDKLGGDPLMQRLEQAQDGATQQLVQGITSKASGVFLWVILVVKRLLRGLRDYDTLSDLSQKLDELPGDLENLYELMLGDMSSQNRRQGSKLLQLVLRSSETHGNIPMTVLQLSFAEEEEYSTSSLRKVSNISSRELDWRCEATEGRMRSRCGGLIEVQDPPKRKKPYKQEPLVGFLHKTVVDFLRSRTVWDYLLSLTAKSDFDVNQALLMSTLSEMMVQSQSSKENIPNTHAVYGMLRFLAYEENMEDMTELLISTYKPALKTTMATIWYEKDLFDSPSTQQGVVTAVTDRTRALYNLNWLDSSVLVAATQCPRDILNILLDEIYPADAEARLRQAAYLLTQFMNEAWISVRMLTVERLMTCAKGSPNASLDDSLRQGFPCDKYWLCHARAGSFTIPILALSYAHYLTELPEDDLFHSHSPSCFLDLWISMLEAGVRADVLVPVESRVCSGSRFQSWGTTALKIVQALMSRIWKGFEETQARLNAHSCGAQLPESDAKHIDAVAAKCCRIDRLSIGTCGTGRLMFLGYAGERAANTASVEVDCTPVRGVKRKSDLTESTEANERPRHDMYDDSSEAEDLEPSPWAIHRLHCRVEEGSEADEGREVWCYVAR